MTAGVTAVIQGGDTPTNFGEQYFFTNPRMETGDARYFWVNQTMLLGRDDWQGVRKVAVSGR